MADTVKTRALAYAIAKLERQYTRGAVTLPPRKQLRIEAGKLVNGSLLALARINLGKEKARERAALEAQAKKGMH